MPSWPTSQSVRVLFLRLWIGWGSAAILAAFAAACTGSWPGAYPSGVSPYGESHLRDSSQMPSEGRPHVSAYASRSVLGWDFAFEGDRAQWMECLSEESCGRVERSCLAGDVLAVQAISRTRALRADGQSDEEVVVQKITLRERKRTQRLAASPSMWELGLRTSE